VKTEKAVKKAMLFKRKIKASKGTTLIELLIVTAISALIVLALLSLYSAGQRYFVTQSAKADTIEDSRHPLTWITRDIRESVQVVTTYDAYSTSSNSLILQVPSIDETGEIIDVDNTFDYIIYRRNPGTPKRLERIIDADEASARTDRTKLLADNVNSFSLLFFDSDGADTSANVSESATIGISLTSRKDGLGRTFQETFNTQIKLRNK